MDEAKRKEVRKTKGEEGSKVLTIRTKIITALISVLSVFIILTSIVLVKKLSETSKRNAVAKLYDSSKNLSSYVKTVIKNVYDTNKTKTFDTLLEKGTAANASLATSIGMSFAFFFRENGVGIDNKKASPVLLEFIKTQKYKEFKEEKFKLIKKLLEHGQDPKGYILLHKVLTLVNDEEDLDNLLKNRTQKELVQ